MTNTAGKSGFRAPGTRVGQVLAVLAVVGAVLVLLSWFGISFSVFRTVSPTWVGVLFFGYLGLRFVRAVERVGDGLE